MSTLSGRKIAILATDGFEHSELFEPLKAFKEAGASVDVISLKKGKIKSWKDNSWGQEIEVNKTVTEASSNDYDGLMLPGGVINPDLLRKEESAISFVRSFNSGNSRKPIAAICHGPWLLVEAGIAEGKKMTSYASIKTDLKNAGVNWVDQEVVCDNGIVTSRSPQDLKPFIAKAIEEYEEGTHEKGA